MGNRPTWARCLDVRRWMIAVGQPVCVDQVAREFGVSYQTASVWLDELRQRGLAERGTGREIPFDDGVKRGHCYLWSITTNADQPPTGVLPRIQDIIAEARTVAAPSAEDEPAHPAPAVRR